MAADHRDAQPDEAPQAPASRRSGLRDRPSGRPPPDRRRRSAPDEPDRPTRPGHARPQPAPAATFARHPRRATGVSSGATSRSLGLGSRNLSRAPSSPRSCSAATHCRGRVAGRRRPEVPPAARRARRGLTDALGCRSAWIGCGDSGLDRRRACERPSVRLGRERVPWVSSSSAPSALPLFCSPRTASSDPTPLGAISAAVLHRRIAACRLELGTTTTGIVVGSIRDGAKPPYPLGSRAADATAQAIFRGPGPN